MPLVVEIEIIESIEEKHHIRLVPQYGLVQVDKMVVSPCTRDRSIDDFDFLTRQLCAKFFLQISVDRLGVLEHRITVLDVWPQASQPVGCGSSHEEDPIGPWRLGDGHLLGTPEAL